MANNPYKAFYNELKQVYSFYGGMKALLCSIYFHASILVTFFLFRHYLYNGFSLSDIFGLIKTITPSLLAFVLSGLAIFCAMCNDDFRKLISGSEKNEKGETTETSPLIDIAVAFTHFSLFQTLSLFNAIVGGLFSWSSPIYVYFSVWLFVYSMLLVLAAIMTLFETFKWYDES